ncbi:MAG: branched-chain amino acid ABC transporter permease [Spirochaetaceae bacterium]
MEYFIQLFMSGTVKGSIYALIALGYTMVYGIIQLINFAHGEIYMIGAFTALIIGATMASAGVPTGLVLVVALFAAMVWAAAYGVTLEKIAYKPLRNSPRLSALISAIGMSIFLQNYVLLAQTSNFIPFPNWVPQFAFLENIKGILNSNQFFILLTTAVVMILFTLMIRYTKMGKAMRATAQDKSMAQLVGINVNQVISITFILGSITAALGGVLICSYMGQINYYIGFIAGIKAFVAAVLGGIGSIPGAVLGSFVLGWTESLGAGYLSSDYEDAFAFIILIIILLVRPSGLLGKKEIKKV